MGYLERGRLNKGTRVQLLGRNCKLKGTVNNIEKFKQTITQGVAGDRLGLSLKGVHFAQIQRGMLIIPDNYTILYSILARAKIMLLTKEDGGRENAVCPGFEPVLCIRSLAISAEFLAFNNSANNGDGSDSMLLPGESCEVDLKFRFKVPLEEGLRFTIIEKNKTIGSGIIIDVIKD